MEINGYNLIEPPFQGGMALVYKGEKNGFSRAFKFVRPDKAENSHRLCEQFLKEINIQAQLDHPNIVKMLDAYPYENDEGTSFTILEMEWLNGMDLQKYITEKNKSGLQEINVKTILNQILDGLEYAHNHNILHLDLKPSNIFRTVDGYIKIIDFGIARVVGDNAEIIEGAERLTHVTETGESTFKGTLAFASPEQQVGGKLSFASDIYSLGKTLRFLCNGTTDPSVEVRSELLSGIIEKCTIENPTKRFQTCAEIRDALTKTPTRKTGKCRNKECGKVIPANVKYCPYCGTEDPLKEIRLECPRCHKFVEENYKGCPDCGQRLFDKDEKGNEIRIVSIWKCSCGKETICYDDKRPKFCNHCGKSENETTLTKI